jgi:hypothetical protein
VPAETPMARDVRNVKVRIVLKSIGRLLNRVENWRADETLARVYLEQLRGVGITRKNKRKKYRLFYDEKY